MCSGYPRTKILLLDAMASYQKQLRAEGLSPTNAANEASRHFARDVVTALDEVRAMAPRLSYAREKGITSILNPASINPGVRSSLLFMLG